MNTLAIILMAVILWTVVSVCYVISRLGYKDHRVTGFRRWAELALSPPVLVLAALVGFLGWLSTRKRGL